MFSDAVDAIHLRLNLVQSCAQDAMNSALGVTMGFARDHRLTLNVLSRCAVEDVQSSLRKPKPQPKCLQNHRALLVALLVAFLVAKLGPTDAAGALRNHHAECAQTDQREMQVAC